MTDLSNGFFRTIRKTSENSNSYALPNGTIVSAETFDKVLSLAEQEWSGRSLTKDSKVEKDLEQRTQVELDKEALVVGMPESIKTILNNFGYHCDDPVYGGVLTTATHRDTPDYQVIIMPQTRENMEAARGIRAKAGYVPLIIFYGRDTDKASAESVGAYAFKTAEELEKLLQSPAEYEKVIKSEKPPVAAEEPDKSYTGSTSNIGAPARVASPGRITREIKMQSAAIQEVLKNMAGSVQFNQ